MTNFWDSNIWSLLLLGGMLFASMLIAHILKKNITFLQKSLIIHLHQFKKVNS